MYKSAVLLIALRYICSNKINKFSKYIGWFSSTIITVSITLIIVLLSMINGFEYKLKENFLHFMPHIIITANQGYTYNQNFPHFLLKDIYKDIIYIKPLVVSNVILQSTQKISFGTMMGINPNHFEPLSDCLIKNKISQLISGKYYVIIGSMLAQQLLVNINDQIQLTIPFVHKGIFRSVFPSQRLFTISDIYISNNEIDNYQILVHQDDAATLMCYPSECISGWRIWLRDPLQLNKFNYLDINKDWNWKDWSKLNGSLFQAIKLEKNAMFLLFILIILVIGFNISSFLVLLIMDKKKEIAILKTYGLNRFKVIILLFIQGIYRSIFSIIFGTILGIVLSKNFNQILYFLNIFPKTLLFPIEIQYFQIFSIDLWVFSIIMLLILYPIWRIASMNSIQLLYDD